MGTVSNDAMSGVPWHEERTLVKRYVMGVAVALSLAVAACGSDGVDTGEAASEGFNQADAEFAQGMIPHHEQAVEMAELAEENAESAEVQELADEIEAAQGPEIEQMTGFLEEWGAPLPEEGMGNGQMEGMDHGGMAGMMTEGEMAELEAAMGAEFDRLFLEMMVRHHEGAVEMAEVELAEGEDAEAQALAEEIIETQEAEIAEMEDLLAEAG